MVIFCSWARPPLENTRMAWLLRSGKTWSVIVRWPRSAKTSTEDRSTSIRSVTLPFLTRRGAYSTLGNVALKPTLPDLVRSR